MTQKKIGNDLYVFKQEAYEITQDTDAEKIFIQLELVDAFKALNEGLASKIVPINYNLFQESTPRIRFLKISHRHTCPYKQNRMSMILRNKIFNVHKL